MSNESSVTVVGGGFSALTCAFFLKKAGFEVIVRNPQGHWGGLMQTKSTPQGIVETGPNALMADSLVEDLAKEIGIELLPHKKTANKKFIYKKGFKSFPFEPWNLFSLASFGIRYKFFKKSLNPKSGETLYQWGKRFLGESITKNVLSVAMQGIYASEAKRLSAELIVPGLLSSNPVPKGKFRGSSAPRWGMGDWINGLVNHLEKNGVTLVKNSKLENQPKGLVVLACSLRGTKNILGSWGDYRGFLLNKIKLIDMLSVTIFFKPMGKEKKGFGCLFPRGQGVLASGVLFNTYVFEGRVSEGINSETWIFSSELVKADKNLLDLKDEEIIEIILNDRRKTGLGVVELVHSEISRWPESIPLYSPETKLIIDQVPQCKDQVYLHGNFMGSLGLAKILYQSRELAKKLKSDFLSKEA